MLISLGEWLLFVAEENHLGFTLQAMDKFCELKCGLIKSQSRGPTYLCSVSAGIFCSVPPSFSPVCL